MEKKILILSEGFGAGHTQAAYALAEAIQLQSPTTITKVVELGASLHPNIASLVFRAYRKTVTSQPRLYGLLYHYKYKKTLGRFSQLALHRLFYAQTENIIKKNNPDVIISTHPFPSTVVSRLIRAGLRIPLYTVITDYDAHGTWVNPETSHYFVSTDEVRMKLIERDVPEDHIEVTGIPVHPNFWHKEDRHTALSRLKLRNLPTVLIMGGGWGLLEESSELVECIHEWKNQIQFIICLGNNQKLLEQMKANPIFDHRNIQLYGFSEEVHRFMDASDLLITKPGGMTCTEGMIKGIPMLFIQPTPGQEESNCNYFIENGYAHLIDTEQSLQGWFEKLTTSKDEWEKFKQKNASHMQNREPGQCASSVLDKVRQLEYS